MYSTAGSPGRHSPQISPVSVLCPIMVKVMDLYKLYKFSLNLINVNVNCLNLNLSFIPTARNFSWGFASGEVCKKIQKRFEVGLAFNAFPLIRSYVIKNEKKIVKNASTQNFKNPKQYFARTTEKKLREKFEKNSKAI